MAPPVSTPPVAVPALLTLSNPFMGRLKPARIFKDAVEPPPARSPGAPPSRSPAPPRQITGVSFDDRGDQVVTSGEDEAFRLYNCKTGKHLKTLYSKKYGVDHPRFTHKSSAIIYASTKEDDTIRYHSLHDNKYLQYFKGHKDKVVSLEMAPVDDGFISGSLDNTVRLWDLRTPQCRGLLHLPSSAIVAYDASGQVFAVGVNHYQRVLIYDLDNFDKAPFMTITLEDPTLARVSFPPRPIYMTSLAFSANGKLILVGCSGDAHYILDAYEPVVLAKLEGHGGLERRAPGAPQPREPTRGCSGEEVSWTPDSKYVISGSLDGRIHVWDAQNLPEGKAILAQTASMEQRQPIASLDGHPGPSRAVKFNPRFAMMCSAGTELAFWLPDPLGDVDELARDLLKKK